MTDIKPYGDWTDDGKVQLSFTLPIPEGERARQAALELARRMGFEKTLVAHMKSMGPNFTFFVVYGVTSHSVDPDLLEVTEQAFPELSYQEVNHLIRERLKRQLVVVGACTGTDAHTVGLDAILSMKGYAGDHGLEYFPEMRVLNLGSQVTPEEIVETVERSNADAVLVSQVVTQRDAHIHHLTEVREALEAAGQRKGLILVGGGPRFSPEQAAELGYDHIFGRGTKPSEVASYLAWTATERWAA
ncbi:MAG: beta-lysine 5,6-aminomutase beta subunit [Actinomycetota bacterium]|jgi:beta-lysine 5,6-aminomutase beta subunit|nr:beta-lysine 5,6-aminomutase beta subunit [Actinomycetota bacterium]